MTISSTNRKAGPYTGNGTTTVFPFYFKVFAAADVEVVRLNVATNVETTLALTTDYTVALNTDQNANPGGSITLVAGALATGYNLVVTSDIGNLQPTDLTNQGGFYPDVINDALDRATIQIQQLQTSVDRAALLPITSDADAASLVADIVRLADSADNLDIDANNIASINTVAGSISNVNSVASNITNVNAVAGNATNINAVAGNSTNINAVNSNKTNIDTVAGNNTNITTVAGISANVTSVAGNSTNINAVAGNATNINAVNANSTNINAVNSNKTNIDTVATNATAVTTVSTNMTAVTSAYTNIAAIIDAPTQAANAASSAAQAAASAASGMYSAVQDKSANYTILAADAGDLIRVTTTSGAITITLPLISGVGDGFKIAVVKWTSDSNVVNIARSGSDTINGATSAQIGSQYSQIIFVADLETGTWFASQTGLGATNVNVDVFSGAGGTGFTLTSDPGTKNNTAVYISGVYQQKSTYTISGTTLTFSTAPPTGTSNIEVAYATPLAIGTPSDGTVTTAKIVDANVTAAKIASGAAVSNIGYTPVNKAGDTITGGNWLDFQNSQGNTVKGVRSAQLGYGAPYTAVQVGSGTSNQNVALGVDVTAVSGGSFSGNGKDIFVPNAANFMQPVAAGTDWTKPLGFETGGRVLMPNQPAFYHDRTSSNIPVNNGVTGFNNSIFNRGGHYNGSTGVFTAPATGAYVFSMCPGRSDPGAEDIQIYFRKNGTMYGSYAFDPANNTVNGQYWYFVLNAVISLNVNDTVDLYVGSGSGYFTRTSGNWFSGFFIG